MFNIADHSIPRLLLIRLRETLRNIRNDTGAKTNLGHFFKSVDETHNNKEIFSDPETLFYGQILYFMSIRSGVAVSFRSLVIIH